MRDSLSKARRRGCIATDSRSSSSQYELAPSQKHRSNLGTALRQKVIHHHECTQAEIQAVTEERQSMQLKVEKLQSHMERNEKFVSEAWESAESGRGATALRGAAPAHKKSCVSGSEEPERFKDTPVHGTHREPEREPPKRRRGVIRGQVAAARFTLEQRREAVRVAVQTQKADAELSLRVANAEARISALEQKVSEREPGRLRKLLRKTLTSKCSSWSIRKRLRTKRTPTAQHSCRVADGISLRSGADQMGARGEDPGPCRPTANSSSSRQRAQDAVIWECGRLRQAVEKVPEVQEVKVVFDLATQSMCIQ